MQNQHSSERNNHKKSAKFALWIMIALGLLFCLIIVRFVLTGTNGSSPTGLPTQEETYQVAQQFIKDDSRSGDISFADDDYRYAKQSDSVYAVKATAALHTDAEGKQTHYTLKMRYNGGPAADESSWSLLAIRQD